MADVIDGSAGATATAVTDASASATPAEPMTDESSLDTDAREQAQQAELEAQDERDDAFFDKLDGKTPKPAKSAAAKPKPSDAGKTDPDDDGQDDDDDDSDTERETREDTDDDDEADPDDGDEETYGEDDFKLLKRAKLHKSPTILALKGAEREAFLTNLRARVQYTDQKGQEAADLRRRNAQLQEELQQLKAGTGTKPGQQRQQQTAADAETDDGDDAKATPDLDTAWDAVTNTAYTDDMPKTLRSAVRAEVRAIAAKAGKPDPQVMSSIGTIGAMLEQLHFEQAMTEWEPPEGVDKNSDKVRDAIRREAELLFGVERQRQGQKFNPRTFNLRHAAQRAASLLFNEKASTAAAAKTRREQSRRARRGSPESGGRAPSARPPGTQEERDQAYFDAHPEIA